MKVEGESEILASLVAVKFYLITEQFRGTNLGSKFGEQIWGENWESKFREENFGSKFGEQIWGANLGSKFGKQIWGAKMGSEIRERN